MNPGLNPAMSVELGRRALMALLTYADRLELWARSSPTLYATMPIVWHPQDNFAWASESQS